MFVWNLLAKLQIIAINRTTLLLKVLFFVSFHVENNVNFDWYFLDSLFRFTFSRHIYTCFQLIKIIYFD